MKLVTVWSAEGRDKDGLPCRDPGSGSCNGAIESIATRDTDHVPSLFAKRVLRKLERRGVDRVAHRVVLGDGATWIWNFADEHLPDAVQIVDIFHAKQHIFDVAKAIYGPGSDLAAHSRPEIAPAPEQARWRFPGPAGLYRVGVVSHVGRCGMPGYAGRLWLNGAGLRPAAPPR